MKKRRIKILGEIYDILFHKYKLKLRINRMFKIIDNNFLVLQVSVPMLEIRKKIWDEIYDTLFHKMGKWK